MAGLLRATTGRCNGAPLTILDSSPNGPWPLAQELIAVLVSVAPTIRSPSPSPGPPLAHCPPPNLHRTQSLPLLTVMRTFPAAAAVATTSSVSVALSTVSGCVAGMPCSSSNLSVAISTNLPAYFPPLPSPHATPDIQPPSGGADIHTHPRCLPPPLPDNPSKPIKIIDGKFNGDGMRPYLAAINPSYKDTQGRYLHRCDGSLILAPCSAGYNLLLFTAISR